MILQKVIQTSYELSKSSNPEKGIQMDASTRILLADIAIEGALIW